MCTTAIIESRLYRLDLFSLISRTVSNVRYELFDMYHGSKPRPLIGCSYSSTQTRAVELTCLLTYFVLVRTCSERKSGILGVNSPRVNRGLLWGWVLCRTPLSIQQNGKSNSTLS